MMMRALQQKLEQVFNQLRITDEELAVGTELAMLTRRYIELLRDRIR
jgi:hypothetical protein